VEAVEVEVEEEEEEEEEEIRPVRACARQQQSTNGASGRERARVSE
jgi:hypothetical protein